MSAAVLRTPTHEHEQFFGGPVTVNPSALGHNNGLTHSAVDSITNNPQIPSLVTRPSYTSTASSYSMVSAPTTEVNFSNTPLGSSYSETMPPMPGAWNGTAPGTPAPIKDDVNALAQQVQQTNFVDKATEVLPASVAQYLPNHSTKEMTDLQGQPSLRPAAEDEIETGDIAAPIKQLANDPPRSAQTEPVGTTVYNTVASLVPAAVVNAVSSTVPGSMDPSVAPSARDAPAEAKEIPRDVDDVASPIKQLADDPTVGEPAEPVGTTVFNKVASFVPASVVNAVSSTVPGSMDPSVAPTARDAPVEATEAPLNSTNERAPAFSNFAPEDHGKTTDQVMGSRISPDDEVQEAAKNADSHKKEAFLVPVVPLVAALGAHEYTHAAHDPTSTSRVPAPIEEPQPQSQLVNHAPNQVDDYPTQHDRVQHDVQPSTRASKTADIQRKAKELVAVVPVIVGAKDSEASSTANVPSTTGPDSSSALGGAPPHSAYPASFRPSMNERLNQLSTMAVGGDTSVTSISSSVDDSSFDATPTRYEGIAEKPVFSEEQSHEYDTFRGRDAAMAAGATAGGGAAAIVAAKERDEREGKRHSRAASPGSPKGSVGRFSGIRKLTKGGKHSRSGSASEGTASPNRQSMALPANAAFPASTYPVDEQNVQEPTELNNDPALNTLPESSTETGIVEPTSTPAAASVDHKPNKLTKKHSPIASESSPRASTSSDAAGPHTDGDTKEAHSHKTPKAAAEAGHVILVNGSSTGTTKPKLMDRIKGEVKIMQGTIRGDEGKKMEGRMLKEFGHF